MLKSRALTILLRKCSIGDPASAVYVCVAWACMGVHALFLKPVLNRKLLLTDALTHFTQEKNTSIACAPIRLPVKDRKMWKEGSLTNFGEVGHPSQWADVQWISLDLRCSRSCMGLTSMWDQRLPGRALPWRTLPLLPQCSQAPGPLSL